MWTGSYRAGVCRFQRIERGFTCSPVYNFHIPSQSSDCISILRVRECCGTARLKGMLRSCSMRSIRYDRQVGVVIDAAIKSNGNATVLSPIHTSVPSSAGDVASCSHHLRSRNWQLI
jgi:hypothetical protein